MIALGPRSFAFALTLCGAALPATQDAGGMVAMLAERPGTEVNAEFGRRLVAAHDFDRDGTRDWIASSLVPPSSTAIGVHSGDDGALIREVRLPRSYPAGLCETITSLGDVDGDGVPELAIGEQHFGGSLTDGAVWVHSGATGALLWSLTHLRSSEHLGSGIAAVGDVDGDGAEDLLVHASMLRQQSPPYRTGGALLLSGRDGSEMRRFEVGDYYHTATGESRVAGAGDVDGDGVPDLLVSGVGDSDVYSRGRCVMYSGATGAALHEQLGTTHLDSFGVSVAGVGDVNGDRVPDYAIADPRPGLVHVHSGRTGTRLLLIEGPADGDFGVGLIGGRDLDGDDVPDLLLTDFRQRELYLASGASGTIVATIGEIRGADGPGFAVCMLQDRDRNGRHEFAWSGAASTLPGALDGSGFVRSGEYRPGLTQDRRLLSAAAGGTVNWALEFPLSEAGQPYRLLASGHGATPEVFEGVVVPLVQDQVFARMLSGPPRGFTSAIGVLDANASAQVSLTLLPARAAPWLGATVWFAAVVGPPGALSGASVATTLTILP